MFEKPRCLKEPKGKVDAPGKKKKKKTGAKPKQDK
jgi:hypothetical protein